MKVDIVMPKLGESIMEGTIIKWSKQVGEAIKKDETLLEISTDKVDSEIPSPVEGTLVEILAQENQTIGVGEPIARVETAQGSGPKETPGPSPSEEKIPIELSEKKIEIMRTRTMKRPPLSGSSEEPNRQGFYSPLVRSIAGKEGVSMDELGSIEGSGQGGRVTKRNILRYLEERKDSPKAPSITGSSIFPKSLATKMIPGTHSESSTQRQALEIIPMDPVRKKIALHMRQSLDTSAHVYSVAECDMTRVRQLIDQKKSAFEKAEGFKLTFNPFVLWSVTKALKDFPSLNSSIEGDQIIQKNFINLGMAVATDRGLLVPVIKDAEEKSFRGLARKAYDLAIRTRNRKLAVEDIEGATFSVTNPGVFGNIFGLPIINQPNVGILGVGAIKKRPVVIESEYGDTIAIRSMVYLSLSFDHRLIDGDIGGRFLQQVVYYLENFPEEI